MLAVERHNDKLWLVLYKTPSTPDCILLAEFTSDEAGALWTQEHNRSMCMAREIGRAGIG